MKREVLRSCPVPSDLRPGRREGWSTPGKWAAGRGGGLCRRPAVDTDQLCSGLCEARVTRRGMRRVAGRWVCKLC